MSNLKTARNALLAELRHVEKGVAYYQKRAEALRAALQQLELTEDAAAPTAKKTAIRRTTSAPKKQKNTQKTASSKQPLPKTSQEFWLGFIGQEPKTAAEIGNAAVASLGFTPAPDQAKKLKSRLAPTLQALLTAKKVKDTGSGRERKFSLAARTASASGAAKGKGRTTSSPAVSNGLTNGSATHH